MEYSKLSGEALAHVIAEDVMCYKRVEGKWFEVCDDEDGAGNVIGTRLKEICKVEEFRPDQSIQQAFSVAESDSPCYISLHGSDMATVGWRAAYNDGPECAGATAAEAISRAIIAFKIPQLLKQ